MMVAPEDYNEAKNFLLTNSMAAVLVCEYTMMFIQRLNHNYFSDHLCCQVIANSILAFLV